jgi:hypothetical protein
MSMKDRNLRQVVSFTAYAYPIRSHRDPNFISVFYQDSCTQRSKNSICSENHQQNFLTKGDREMEVQLHIFLTSYLSFLSDQAVGSRMFRSFTLCYNLPSVIRKWRQEVSITFWPNNAAKPRHNNAIC